MKSMNRFGQYWSKQNNSPISNLQAEMLRIQSKPQLTTTLQILLSTNIRQTYEIYW